MLLTLKGALFDPKREEAGMCMLWERVLHNFRIPNLSLLTYLRLKLVTLIY